MKANIVLVVLLTARSLAACVCAGSTGFFAASGGALVIDGVVQSYVHSPQHMYPLAMDVEVKRVLNGEYAARTIRIVGDFGMSCVPYVSNFPVGTEWLFAVHGPVEIPRMGDENFAFAPCANAWLAVIGNHASGVLEWMNSGEVTLSEVQARLRDGDAAIIPGPPFSSVPHASTPPHLSGPARISATKGCTTLDKARVDVVVDSSGTIRDFTLAREIPPCLRSALSAALRNWRFDTKRAARFSVVVSITSTPASPRGHSRGG